MNIASCILLPDNFSKQEDEDVGIQLEKSCTYKNKGKQEECIQVERPCIKLQRKVDSMLVLGLLFCRYDFNIVFEALGKYFYDIFTNSKMHTDVLVFGLDEKTKACYFIRYGSIKDYTPPPIGVMPDIKVAEIDIIISKYIEGTSLKLS